MRAARPGADVGLINGGGLRADLPAGELTYGAVVEAFPFDNKLTSARLSGKELRAVLAHHFASGGGIVSVSGIRVEVSCTASGPSVRVVRDGGKPVGDDETVEIVASDFMLTGGDDFWGPVKPPELATGDVLIREAMVGLLRTRPTLREADLFDRAHPRMVYPAPRPVRCGAK
jgi:2',3'-cyclic-nucleotide 2'-phosphodiesterase (5'-nucleotidase family)